MPAMQELSIDDTYKLLSSSRRRAVVGALLDTTEATPQSDVVDHVAASDGEVQRDDESDSDFRTRIYTSLYQLHFPKLDDYGVITHDRDTATLQKGPNFEAVAEWVRKENGQEPAGGVA